MKKFAVQYPFWFAQAVTLAATLCLIVPVLAPGLTMTTKILLGRVAICIFAIAILTGLGWWKEAGFVRPAGWRFLIPYLPVIGLLALMKTLDILSLGINISDFKLIMLGFAVYMAGGFFEEAIFRGVVLRALIPGGLVRASLLSALIFGLVHFANLVGGANLNATLLQVAVAMLVGFCFTAPLALTRNIWPLVVLHGLNNFVGFLTAGGWLDTGATSKSPTLVEAIMSIVLVLLFALASYWILVRVQKKTQAALA